MKYLDEFLWKIGIICLIMGSAGHIEAQSVKTGNFFQFQFLKFRQNMISKLFRLPQTLLYVFLSFSFCNLKECNLNKFQIN